MCNTKWLKEAMAKSHIDDVYEQGDTEDISIDYEIYDTIKNTIMLACWHFCTLKHVLHMYSRKFLIGQKFHHPQLPLCCRNTV